jgi:RNA polymerase sigma factor (sigma-70 family)
VVTAVRAAPSAGASHDEEVAEFFRANHKLVRWYLITVCGCPEHQADDITQDAFLAVRDRWGRVRDFDQPRAYLLKVARRRYWHWRQQRNNRYCDQDPEEYFADAAEPRDPFSETDDKMFALALVRRLPPRQRQVLLLRLGAGFSEAETAAALSVRIGTVKSQLHDAKVRLQDLLREDRGGEPQQGQR